MTSPSPSPRSRESVAAALYLLVSTAAGKVENLKTSSRRVRHYQDVTSDEMPALFQTQTTETQKRANNDLPALRTMHFNLWLYTAEAQEPSIIPSQQLNTMVDAIERALAPFPLTGKQDLGGLVAHAWIEGNIEIYEGVTEDGKSIALIPIAVLLP
jgi:hypothetical protein